MITETAFIGCKNIPQAMAASFDRPWKFLGEVKANRGITMPCSHGSRRHLEPLLDVTSTVHGSYSTVYLERYLFITDSMIEVVVYFGTCDKCHAVYWARSGPPFRYVGSCVGGGVK